MTEINLLATTDATIWTDEWLQIIKENPSIRIDRKAMIGWFANAIMCGYDHGRSAEAKLWKERMDLGWIAKTEEWPQNDNA